MNGKRHKKTWALVEAAAAVNGLRATPEKLFNDRNLIIFL